MKNMMITRARAILEEYRRGEDPMDIDEAIDTAIDFLPRECEVMSAKKRLKTIRETVERWEGFDPFATRRRGQTIVCWRQSVFLLMTRMGYMKTEIARASGYNHSTVVWATQRMLGFLTSGDQLATTIWERLNEITK